MAARTSAMRATRCQPAVGGRCLMGARVTSLRAVSTTAAVRSPELPGPAGAYALDLSDPLFFPRPGGRAAAAGACLLRASRPLREGPAQLRPAPADRSQIRRRARAGGT